MSIKHFLSTSTLHSSKSLHLHSTLSQINATDLLLVKDKRNNPVLVAQMKGTLHL